MRAVRLVLGVLLAASSLAVAGAGPGGGAQEAAAAEVSSPYLVGLDVPFTAEGKLTSAQVSAQRAAIKAAGDAVVAALPGTAVLARYASIPYLGLSMTPTVVRVLRDLRLAAGITLAVDTRPALASTDPLTEAGVSASVGATGAGTAIAVLDTGIDASHPFLAGKVVSEACFSYKFQCPNHLPVQLGSGAGAPCPWTGCDHGTHVAGIAAGKQAGAGHPDINGVARGANLLSVQVFHQSVDPDKCSPDPAPCILSNPVDQLLGLERVAAVADQHNVVAVNMSLGGGSFTGVCGGVGKAYASVFKNLLSKRIIPVVAAGNDSFTNAMGRPACADGALAVANTDDADMFSSSTNVSGTTFMAAPGTNVTSSVPGGGYGDKTGTSMAAPQVAGAIAVLRQVKPKASVSQILSALANGGQPVSDTRTGGVRTNLPRLRLARSLGQAPFAALGDVPLAGTTAITPASATILWSPVTGADRYGVWLNGRYQGSTGGTSWVFRGLVAERDHYAQVVAMAPGAKVGTATVGLPFGTYGPVMPPTGLGGTVGPYSVTLTWTPSPDSRASGYEVLRNGTRIATRTARTDTSATVTGLAAAPADFSVRTTTEDGRTSAVAGPLRLTPLRPKLSAPRSFTIEPTLASGQVLATWTNPSNTDHISGIAIRRNGVTMIIGNLWEQRAYISNVPGGYATWDAVSLYPGDDVAVSASKALDLAIPALPAPSSLTATEGPGRVTLSWAMSTDARVSGYVVERDGTVATVLTGARSTIWTDRVGPGVTTGQHKYTVRTYSGTATKYSLGTSRNARLADPVAPVANLLALGAETTGRVTWTPSTDSRVTGYQIRVGNGPFVVLPGATTSSYAVSGLTAGTTSNVVVYADTATGVGDEATTTLQTFTSFLPPSAIKVSGGGPFFPVVISWSPSLDLRTEGYRLTVNGGSIDRAGRLSTSVSFTSRTGTLLTITVASLTNGGRTASAPSPEVKYLVP